MKFEEKFIRAEITGQDGLFERIDDSNPVGIFLGLDGHQWAVMVICPARPPEPPVLAAISVEVRSRQAGDWALSLRLLRPELKGLFVRLVEDLDGATRLRPEDPGGVVVARLVHWQNLLSRGAPQVLDDDHLRGLIGELDFLISEAVGSAGPEKGVQAWMGPFSAHQDFFLENADVEVKALHPSRYSIQVSSLEQLTSSVRPLFLWTRVVELTTISSGDVNSIQALVNNVRGSVLVSSKASARLEECLQAAGWEDRPEYESRGFRLGAATCYAVKGNFPRLQRSTVEPAITVCRYEIAIDQLDSFKVSSWRTGKASHAG